MEKPNISLVIGAVIKSKIEELKLEETLTHESLGRCSARDLFDGVYRAAMNSNNPEFFAEYLISEKVLFPLWYTRIYSSK